MATKHIPQRTCIACRTVRRKRDLVRIIQTSEGHVEADSTGKKAGRGAYLCRQRECWEIALDSQSRLGQALKLSHPITTEDLTRLHEFATTLPNSTLPPASTNREGVGSTRVENE